MKSLSPASNIPTLTTDQMREVDRAMIEDVGISLVRMMENAGRSLAELARQILGGRVEAKTIIVLAGRGNNGGGGLVAARHLANWGARVVVVSTGVSASEKTIAREQANILEHMGVRILASNAPDEVLLGADLIIDALIGYGLSGPPRGEIAELIRRANMSRKVILSLDAPSGLDTSTGEIFDPCIRAAFTLTLALPKVGLLVPSARSVVGDLYLADISVPPLIYARMGIRVPNIFAESGIVRLEG